MEIEPRLSSQTVVVVRETLSVAAAVHLRDLALDYAASNNVSGAVSVFNSMRAELCAQLTGDDASPSTMDIARGKILTVLETGRSSNLQADRMRIKHYDRSDYVGRIGSLFGGGAAIFKDLDLKIFIGAIGFSGGSQEEDQQICTWAIRTASLYTDNNPNNLVFPAKRV